MLVDLLIFIFTVVWVKERWKEALPSKWHTRAIPKPFHHHLAHLRMKVTLALHLWIAIAFQTKKGKAWQTCRRKERASQEQRTHLNEFSRTELLALHNIKHSPEDFEHFHPDTSQGMWYSITWLHCNGQSNSFFHPSWFLMIQAQSNYRKNTIFCKLFS